MRSGIYAAAFAVGLVAIQAPAALADSASAKAAWQAAKDTRIVDIGAYRDAQMSYAKSKSSADELTLVTATQAALNAILDEANAWLEWKGTEADESQVSADLKATVKADVAKNEAKVQALRGDVGVANTRAKTAAAFLKMVGSYVDLQVDVARDIGLVWTDEAKARLAKLEDYESKLRAAAAGTANETAIVAALDQAKGDIDSASAKIDAAAAAYKAVVTPGTPFAKFAEGNADMREARKDMLDAADELQQALRLLGSA